MSYEEDEELDSLLPEEMIARIQWFYNQLEYQKNLHDGPREQDMMGQLMAIYQEVFRQIIFTKEFE